MAQLDLWQAELDGLPWGGQSPRVLTRSYKSLFLRREPQKDDCFFVDPEQLELFPAAITGPPQYEGAPSLYLLPWEG